MNMLDVENINILVAFVAGFVTFFASCVLPLVPIYIAYLSGVSLSNKSKQNRYIILKTSIFFVMGFILTFVALGITAHGFSALVQNYRRTIYKIGGVMFVILGLSLMGILETKFLSREWKLDSGNWFKHNKMIHAFITGVTFAFAWTPCIGPVLGAILFWSSQQLTLVKGISMLIAYGIGLGIPFVLVGLGFEYIHPLIQKTRNITKWFQKITGLIIAIIGSLMFIGQLHKFSFCIMKIFSLNIQDCIK